MIKKYLFKIYLFQVIYNIKIYIIINNHTIFKMNIKFKLDKQYQY